MKIQITADLHIEYLTSTKNLIDIGTDSEILILAGDIGCAYNIKQLMDFFESIVHKYHHVIYVPGNTEFYIKRFNMPKSLYTLNERLKLIEKRFPNVHILNRKTIQIDKVVFTGCVLWSNPVDTLPQYVRIHEVDKETFSENNKNDITYIKASIELVKSLGLKHVIITHYCPLSFSDFPEFTHPRHDLYFNNLTLTPTPGTTWIYGHIHVCDDREKDGTRYISNSRGKKTKISEDYRSGFSIEIN
jgi:predicted phosphodiesterase